MAYDFALLSPKASDIQELDVSVAVVPFMR